MLIADAIGIIIGIVLGKKIPERFVKWFAAIIFIIFSLLGLYGSVQKEVLNIPVITGSLVLLVVLIYFMARLNSIKVETGK